MRTLSDYARGTRHAAAMAVVMGIAMSATPARGEPTAAEIAAARQLFKDGLELELRSDWDAARERFKKVGAVKMTPAIRFHLALCDENLGRLVAAINGFEIAADEARRGEGAAEVAQNAPLRAAALRQRVPTLQFTLNGQLGSAKIFLDDAPVAPALVDTAIPAEIGSHHIEVRRSGKTVFEKDIELAEHGAEQVTLEVPASAPGEQRGGADGAFPSNATASMAPLRSRTPAIVAGSLGLAAAAGAGVFFGLRQQTLNQLNDACPSQKNCSRSLEQTYVDGQNYTTTAQILAGVAAAGLVTGGVLWFAFPASSAASTALLLSPQGATIAGRF